MANYSNAMGQSGGIVVRDYRESGLPKPFSQKLDRGGSSAKLPAVSFDKLARRLGWFSLVLGVAEIFLSRSILRWLGLRKKQNVLVRLLGVREILQAFFTFMQGRPSRATQWRLAGDVLNLGLLLAGFVAGRAKKLRLGLVAALIAGATALDILTAAKLRRKNQEEKRASMVTEETLHGQKADGRFQVQKSITINRSAEEIYRFWRNFENLPRFMQHLERVEVIDDNLSHWVAKAPAGSHVRWDARVTEDRPNVSIAWEAMPDSDVQNSGRVQFEPRSNGRGTVVRVKIAYSPPGGAVGRAVARLFGEEPGQQVTGDLRRLKQVLETGEVVRSDGSPEGYGQKMMRPAQPMPENPDDLQPLMPIKAQKRILMP
ncbi:MAG: SRPBCC family protein [Chloroflexota bacterium]